MSSPPVPVVFEPLYKPKPWGGRRLATLLGKRLPAGVPIGESWELADLPDNESRVRDGPLAGTTLAELVQRWGADLLGDVQLDDGRFPLLIKFLDACENLSVQVHPQAGPGVKREAWYVVHAEPGAKLYVGLRDGVGPDDVRRVANTPQMADVLRIWAAAAGQCYYLPSGTLHALGAGIVVAEVQTPSDTTYRVYDWDRAGLDGRPRELHVEQGLRNIRYGVTPALIAQPPTRMDAPFGEVTRLVTCTRFIVDHVRVRASLPCDLPRGTLRVWIILRGRGRLVGGAHARTFDRGDVVLIPAGTAAMRLDLPGGCEWLDVAVARQA